MLGLQGNSVVYVQHRYTKAHTYSRVIRTRQEGGGGGVTGRSLGDLSVPTLLWGASKKRYTLWLCLGPLSPRTGPPAARQLSGQSEIWEWGPLLGKGCLRGPGSPSSKAHLEDGVISLLAWAVPRGMSPGDVEEFPFAIDPLEPWVLAAVHLGHQPGLQPHTAGRREGSWGRLVHGLQEKAGQGISRFAAQCSSGRGVWGRSGGPASGCWGFHFLPAPGAGVSPVPQVLKTKSLFQPSAFLSQGPCTYAVFGDKGRRALQLKWMLWVPRPEVLYQAGYHFPSCCEAGTAQSHRAVHCETCPHCPTPG